MILVDTSIWVDHLHQADTDLGGLLDSGLVACHPMIIGELTLGSLRERETFLALLADLPSVSPATHDEVMTLVGERRLFGRGLGLVDAHLLASVLVTPDARIWTRDRRLGTAAEELGITWQPASA